jgi:hypothetical protein
VFYDFAITIPPGTAEEDPEELELKLTKGVIHKVIVEAHPGCHATAKIRIYHHEHQLWPTNPDEAFALDSIPREFDEHFILSEAPYTLKVRGYSPAATYEHEYRLGIGILTEEEVSPLSGFRGLFERFFKLVGLGR